MKPIVFLDRDGTINVDHGYVTDPARVELIEGAAEGLLLLSEAGFDLVIVTNQSAIGRQMATSAEVEATNHRVLELVFDETGVVFHSIRYCPHHPDAGCECRKPKTGLVSDIIKLPDFDPLKAYMVGDKMSDIDFGRNIGIADSNLFLLPNSSAKAKESSQGEIVIASSLLAAAKVILKSHH